MYDGWTITQILFAESRNDRGQEFGVAGTPLADHTRETPIRQRIKPSCRDTNFLNFLTVKLSRPTQRLYSFVITNIKW